MAKANPLPPVLKLSDVTLFLMQLKAAKKHFEPRAYEYVANALEKIAQHEDANIAFGLKKAGRGNKITVEQFHYEMRIGTEIYCLLPDHRENVTLAAQHLYDNRDSLLPKDIAKKLGYRSAASAKKIYYKRFGGKSSDDSAVRPLLMDAIRLYHILNNMGPSKGSVNQVGK